MEPGHPSTWVVETGLNRSSKTSQWTTVVSAFTRSPVTDIGHMCYCLHRLDVQSLFGYLKIIPCTKFEHFGVICFWVMLQTNRQTRTSSHADWQSVIYQSEQLVGDVAVPVSVRQVVLFCALWSPDERPRLNWRKSFSTVLSQVCLGRPGCRLQFLGEGDMQACRAHDWLRWLATWPNNSGVWSAQYLSSPKWPIMCRWGR